MKEIFWPNYNSDGNPKLGLSRILNFLDKIGNPQNKITNIFHIAGTNGKGSTTAYLKSILEEEGYLVHRYTSPHLVNLNERIEVSSKIISDDYFNDLAYECKQISETYDLPLSYFEGLTVMAFLAFSRNLAKATILEVGLGGRLDATNVITNPLVSVITSISYDHMSILGDTLEKIAIEKAGIIKKDKTLIIDRQQEVVMNTLMKIATENNNTTYAYNKEWSIEKLNDCSFVFKGFGKILELPIPSLEGEYQLYNAGGAIASLLAQKEIDISEKSIINGLKKVNWNGRLQNLSNNNKLKEMLPIGTEVIIDGAHNEDAASKLHDYIVDKNTKNKKYNILIIAMLDRKDSLNYIKNLKNIFDLVIITKLNAGKEISKDSKELMQNFLSNNCNNIIVKDNFEESFSYILQNFSNGDNLRVIASGSLYLVGEILEFIEK